MWTRKDLKMNAKASFKGNYWRCVFVALILFAIVGSGAGYSASRGYNVANSEISVSGDVPALLIGIVLALITVVGLLAMLIHVLVIAPLYVGCYHFFSENSKEKALLGKIGRGFSPYYWRTVGAMFLRGLFLFLWSLLFIIPGMIKSYSYALVPYIIADKENITAREAITLSRKMMSGNKWKLFVLQLSFIGWELVSVVTLGIAGVFYVNPYVYSTYAEFYLTVKEEYEKKA